MAVAAQQALRVTRRPLRVGRIRYGLWWLDQVTAGARVRARAASAGVATVAGEVRWAAELSARATVAGIARARPEPWTDRGLLALAGAIAVGAVALAVFLGFGMAQWAMTEPESPFFAAAGALAVGLAILPLGYLVFASRRGGCRGRTGNGKRVDRA